MPWIFCGAGLFFCLSGLYLFFKKIYEEGQSVRWALAIIIMGVLLIAAGTAKYLKLIQ